MIVNYIFQKFIKIIGISDHNCPEIISRVLYEDSGHYLSLTLTHCTFKQKGILHKV